MKWQPAHAWSQTLNSHVRDHHGQLTTFHIFRWMKTNAKSVWWCKFKPACQWSCNRNLHVDGYNLKLHVNYHAACMIRFIVMQAQHEHDAAIGTYTLKWCNLDLNLTVADDDDDDGDDDDVIWSSTLKTNTSYNLVTSTRMLMMEIKL